MTPVSDDTLDHAAQELAAARVAVRDATRRLRAAVVAEKTTHHTTDTELARRAQVDRMTILRWLGKRR